MEIKVLQSAIGNSEVRRHQRGREIFEYDSGEAWVGPNGEIETSFLVIDDECESEPEQITYSFIRTVFQERKCHIFQVFDRNAETMRRRNQENKSQWAVEGELKGDLYNYNGSIDTFSTADTSKYMSDLNRQEMFLKVVPESLTQGYAEITYSQNIPDGIGGYTYKGFMKNGKKHRFGKISVDRVGDLGRKFEFVGLFCEDKFILAYHDGI